MIFEKYHGLGNDYLVYDPNKNQMNLNKERIRLICDRNFGLGSDGILEGPLPNENGLKFRVWNPDGSEAEISGNGIRIFSRYLRDAGYVQKKKFILSTMDRDVEVCYLNEQGSCLRVGMGKISFKSDEVPVTGPLRDVVDEKMSFGGRDYHVTCASVGNPHCIIPMEEISKETVCEIGKYSENAPCFPNRINTQIMKVCSRHRIEIEIYERGAGYTLASGSSGCAAAGAAYRLGLVDEEVAVHMPGGVLNIEILNGNEIYMTGFAAHIGTIRPAGEFIDRLSITACFGNTLNKKESQKWNSAEQ